MYLICEEKYSHLTLHKNHHFQNGIMVQMDTHGVKLMDDPCDGMPVLLINEERAVGHLTRLSSAPPI